MTGFLASILIAVLLGMATGVYAQEKNVKNKSGVSHWPIQGSKSPIVGEFKRTGSDWGREKPLPDSVNIKLILIQKEIIELKKEILKIKKEK